MAQQTAFDWLAAIVTIAALAIGLIGHVVPDGQALAKAREIAEAGHLPAEVLDAAAITILALFGKGIRNRPDNKTTKTRTTKPKGQP